MSPSASRPSLLRRLGDAWNRFWFRQVPADTLGLMRISLGLLLVIGHTYEYVSIDLLFGADGPVAPWVHLEGLPWPSWSPYDLVGSREGLLALHTLFLVPHVLFMLGWRSRTMAVLSLLVQAATYHRNPYFQHGGDRVMRLATLYMATAPSGAALSLDAWLTRRREQRAGTWFPKTALVPVVAMRLVQIQWAALYAHSGWKKAHYAKWWDGNALYYAMSAGQYQRAPWALEPLLQNAWVQDLFWGVTPVVLLWELLFPLLLLWRPTRLAAVVIGLLVHGGIALSLMVGSFSFIMMWGYQAMLDPRWLARWRLRRQEARGALPVLDQELP